MNEELQQRFSQHHPETHMIRAKSKQSQEIARQIEQYEKSGGVIQQIPFGVSSTWDQWDIRTAIGRTVG